MQIREEAAFICKVTTNSRDAAALFDYHAQFLSHAYSLIGCTMYVEAITGGAIVFYKTKEDFFTFHKFAAELAPIGIMSPAIPSRKLQELKLCIEIVKKPDDMSIKDLALLMEKSHRILSPDISATVTSPGIVVLRYKIAGTFETIFKKIWDTLGEKLNSVTPSLK